MLSLPAEKHKVSPFFAFYIITSMQVGVGILGFQRNVAKEAGHDSWVSIIIASLALHIVLWMTYQILNKGKNDITVIHKDIFGKWIGGLLSIALIIYLLLLSITVTRNYIEIIQIWMFPEIDTWYLALILLALVYLYVTGGFRVVVGLCLLTFLITFPLLLTFWFPMKEANFSYLLPIMDHSFIELLSGAKEVSFNYVGFETLFFFYPFLKKAENSQKWAQYGVVYSTFVYLLTALVSLVYFSHEQLANTIWGTLTLWKVVDLPFIERFEYAGLAIWLFVILPNLCLYTWAASRGMKQLFKIKQKHGIIVLLIILFIVTISFTDRQSVKQLLTTAGNVGFYVFYIYIPFIYFSQMISHKMRRTK
ncbi:GerAB/ArcD/ProY family transporter [Bacillus sp. Hm123]|uniref:GerAB/ArcD/ProY family transporter n=1 Tax=Bacillus sp. Hm123 TaxID=3450745 RepID=UPI003F42B483